ncbi:MAG: O-antigen ligase family protein, partial [Pseudomonadaceae bacterium]|nr:O-antigen ligase family protein [Pseudomonadaceae bacterium]
AVKLKLVLLIILLSFIALVYLIPQTGVKTRISQAFYDVEMYFSGESKNTSVGLRFDMWQGAIKLIIDKPLTGWGREGYHEGMQALANQGEVTAFAVENHAHNDFLDSFARRGLLGLLTLLMLYLVPLHLFSNYLASPNMELRAVATAGALLPVAFIDFGLSQAFLEHNSGVMIYAFWLVVLWGCLRSVEKKEAA